MTIKLVAISDTHSLHHHLTIPEGDILIHAGDITGHGALNELYDFNDYLGSLPHTHKIVIAGNHDWCFEQQPVESRAILTNCIYLQDDAVTLAGIKFYGSPWQPWFFDWAFNLQRGPEIKAKWDLIPLDTDILITHGPPFGHGDENTNQTAVGCQDLLEAVERIKPKLHIFGHIHEGAGLSHNTHTTFMNASSCTFAYEPINQPLIYEYVIE